MKNYNSLLCLVKPHLEIISVILITEMVRKVFPIPCKDFKCKTKQNKTKKNPSNRNVLLKIALNCSADTLTWIWCFLLLPFQLQQLSVGCSGNLCKMSAFVSNVIVNILLRSQTFLKSDSWGTSYSFSHLDVHSMCSYWRWCYIC